MSLKEKAKKLLRNSPEVESKQEVPKLSCSYGVFEKSSELIRNYDSLSQEQFRDVMREAARRASLGQEYKQLMYEQYQMQAHMQSMVKDEIGVSEGYYGCYKPEYIYEPPPFPGKVVEAVETVKDKPKKKRRRMIRIDYKSIT